MARKEEEYQVNVDLLQTGVYIRLDGVKWYEHPFLFNNFKIKSHEQILTLKELGIKQVTVIPKKSDKKPLPAKKTWGFQKKEDDQFSKQMRSAQVEKFWEIKKQRTEMLQQRRERIAQIESRYKESVEKVNTMMGDISAGRPQAVEQAQEFIEDLSSSFVENTNSSLQLMSLTGAEETVYFHSLNVSVLAMMLGRQMELSQDELKLLGIGALFHDAGKSRIEKKILRKPFKKLTKPELKLIFLHPYYGVDILKDMEKFPKEALKIVYQHHERADGSGFPKKLKKEQTDKLARIVAIANAYDNHCNHIDPMTSLTPYQALSVMYGKQKTWFDEEMLARFIKCLGIYPPGTIVHLSTDTIGMVTTVNPKEPLHPSVVVYDPQVPKKEALIVDLREERDIKVLKSIRPAQLPKEVFDYLSPRTRTTYFVDTDDDGGGAPAAE